MVLIIKESSFGLKGLEFLPSLREYQKSIIIDILKNDVEGINSIVVLPTGTGKTRIASVIIQHFLQRTDKIETIIVFLAGTIQLADQQRRVIAEDLNFDTAGDVNVLHSAETRKGHRKFQLRFSNLTL